MFLDLTSTLTLDKIQVSLLSIDEPSRDFTISTVDEVLVPITCKDTIFTPDFSATGFLCKAQVVNLDLYSVIYPVQLI